MELQKEFSFDESTRLSFVDSGISAIPFQLLPRATYPAAQLERTLVWQEQFVADLKSRPLLSVVLYQSGECARIEDWERMLQSVAVQAYNNIELLLALPDSSPLHAEIYTLFEQYRLNARVWTYAEAEGAELSGIFAEANGEAVLALSSSLLLHPHSLLIVAKELAARKCDVYFANEAVVDTQGAGLFYLRRSPLELYDALSYDQVGRFFCLSRAAAKECAAKRVFAGVSTDLWGWRVSTWALGGKRSAGFIPLGLVVRYLPDEAQDVCDVREIEWLTAQYANSIDCPLEAVELRQEERMCVVRPVLQSVSADVQVVVPFHNKAELTVRCLRSLAAQDCASGLTISLVNNRSEPEQRKRIETAVQELGLGSRCRILDDEGYFNFARLNNKAVRSEDSEFVLFLNNDVELSSPGTISEMLAWTAAPGVDAVGGLLLYEDGSVQHGGINFSSIRPENVSGPEQFSFTAREVNAVSFAMALVRRRAYLQAGQLDESACPNGFGDALFCHELRKGGSKIMYTPYASGIHRESASRGRQPEEMELYELHRSGLPIAALYDDMQARAQPSKLPLAEIEEVPLYALLSRVRRVSWLYNLGNTAARAIIRWWPRR